MEFFRYWGKARKSDVPELEYKGNEKGCHLLAYHCLDVAAVALQWWRGSANIRRIFSYQTGLSEHHTQAWLLFFIALHDYGKYDFRFQLKAPDVWRQVNRGLSAKETRLAKREISDFWHGPAGLYWFYQDWQHRFLCDDDDFLQAEDDNESWLAWLSWLAPVVGHHGSVADQSDKEKKEFAILPHQASKELLQTIREHRQQWLQALEELFLQPAGLSLADDPPQLEEGTFLAGFCSVADWLGSVSGEEGFAYHDQPTDNLKAWFATRLPIAERILQQSGILSYHIRPNPDIRDLLKYFPPRQIQWLVDKLPLSSGLTLIEASTGSGKTEAALAYAWHLLDQNLADSIVFALPTQATANAMLARLESVAPVIFDGAINLVLAHGRARFQQDFIDLQQAARPQTVQSDQEALVQCARWLSESKKRVFLGQLGICTVDQVLVSVLPVRHKFVRGFGLGRSVLIIDEVHAYDAYMYGLLRAVLAQQKAAGGSAILLSATLPEHQKQQLVRAWGGRAKSPTDPVPYPLITHVASQPEQKPVPFALDDCDQQPPVTTVAIELLCLPGLLPDDALLDRMVAAAMAGAQVSLICNLVDVAQNTLTQLRDRAGSQLTDDQLILFHSRFVYRDRQEKEQKVLELFGPEGKRHKGHILVSTQVFECSIDADMDWMITQLCPVDLLFQRWGRLHRHERQRVPGYETPLCTVLLPTEESYELHEKIYGDSRILWRTQQLLDKSDGIVVFPRAYRDWIEPVYQQENDPKYDWSDEPEWVRESHDKFMDSQLIQRTEAARLVKATFSDLSDSDSNVATLTRDGEMNLTVIPVITNAEGQRSLLNGRMIDTLDDNERFEQISLNSLGVPAGWRRKLPEMDKDGLVWLDMELAGSVYQCRWGQVEYHYDPAAGFRRIVME